MKNRMLAILIALILSLNLGIAAAEALPAEEPAELYGSPWVNSTVIGNLPQVAPEVKDDLFTSVNYDALFEANANGSIYIPMLSFDTVGLQSAVMPMVTDESMTGDALTQLRLFWEQASDMDALRAEGYTRIMPYLTRIGEADSIEALNAVLTAEDFPFSPYLAMPTAPLSLKEENGVWIYPAISLTSDYISGANHYNDLIEDIQVLEQLLATMD